MKHRRALGALIVAGTSLAAAACGSGEAATSTAGSKTVRVSMTENEFTPNTFEVDAGEQITFEFTNDGKLDHEAIIGDKAEQDAHEAEMSSTDDMGDMDHGGSDSDAITVKPGDSATITKTFDEAGPVILGCHEPGHYEGGMKATISVT